MAAHGMRGLRPNRNRGLTLVEVMVVVAIVGLLVTIGIPTYQDSVRKARRADGRAALLEMAGLQERFYARNGTYTTTVDADTGLGYGGTTSPEGFYNLSAAACSGGTIGTCYILSATATGNQASDTGCAVLTLDSRTSRRGVDSGGNAASDCW